MSTSKGKSGESRPRYRLCVPPCKRYITSGDAHSMCVVCLGAEHAELALEGADCPHFECLPLLTLRSRKALFEKGAFTSVPCGAGVRSWISRSAATSPHETGSSLLLSSSEEVDVESVVEEPLPQSPQYEELLKEVNRAVAKLKIVWPAEEQAEPQKSKLEQTATSTPDPSLLPRSPHRSLEVVGAAGAAGTIGHLWLTLSDMKEKDRVFLLDAQLSHSGLFGDAVDSVVSRYKGARKHVSAFQWYLPCQSLHEQPQPCTSSMYREEASLLPLPGLQRPVVSGEHTSRFSPPTDIVEPRCSSPLRGSLEQLVWQSPVGPPSQNSKLAIQSTPEASLERLVPLVDYLAVWKLLSNVSAWVLRTVEKSNSIQTFQRGLSHSGGPRAGSGYGSRSRDPSEEGGHRGGPSLRQGVRVLQPVRHCSEEGWRVMSYSRSAPTQPFSHEVEVQNAYCQAGSVTNQVRGLVCDDRSKDAYFHVSILPQHRKFLRFAFRYKAYQYQGNRILNYIDDWLILAQSKSLAARHRDVVLAHMRALGLKLNAKKKCAFSITEDNLSRLGVGFNHDAVASVKKGRSLTVKQFQQLLGLMAAASNMILGLLQLTWVSLLLVAPYWASRVWFSDLISLLDGSPWQILVRRDLLSQAGGTILHPLPRAVKSVSVTPEGAQLIVSGLSTEVAETILQSKAPSTRKLCGLKWRLFTSWCGDCQLDPVNCPIGTVLGFLQARFSTGLTHFTLKVYVVVISAYHAPLGGLSVGKTPWLHISSVVC
ncbi:Gag-Pro-Pol polyprotein [Labeo rohita]|uniref:Gag-Pro-Pol polyprotein n=1 Tax=Labeo rohita TaxID=84645 RepID=A0ABQ8MF22_LABRO|nr:Gag-Pro-Pol polyprotein [Labeo rohita]